MPSFDVVSKVDNHELTNAVDQTNREITSRFDFRGSNSRVELNKNTLTLIAPTDFQLKQVDEILRGKLAKRQVDVRSITYKNPEVTLSEARQVAEVSQGIESEKAKKLVKLIRDKGLKVQAAIQGDQVRVTGKKKDDLQEVIAFLRGANFELPLQFENFRE
ncbi:MAG: YajQ family cyclic di-GMP-binding protein [Gammaproteobacteria bacterium]|nr:YajQ family cyclic di-GMP-binding protein [Gammaproteobacteria bacterium]